MLIQCFAPAKVNLMLHVVGRLANGYHRLQTLMTFANIGDFITIKEKENVDELICTREFACALQGGGMNSVLQAKEWFYRFFQRQELFFKILLEKNLPVAAGIGGGTSDAAAMIAALLAWHQINLSQVEKQKLVKASGILGADVPVCLAFQLGLGSFFWLDGSGIDEIPNVMDIDGSLNLVLINPGVAVNTGMIFRGLYSFNQPFTSDLAQPMIVSMEDLMKFVNSTHNDLEKPARRLYPDIPNFPEIITNFGKTPVITRQSGSGATYFVLTETSEASQILGQALRQAYPDWWIKVGRTLE